MIFSTPKRVFHLLLLVGLCLLSGISPVVCQTPGLVVKSASVAGRAVLDPDGNGYISATTAGFSANDLSESEIPYTPLAVPGTEPTSDLANGPNCGFTDFVDAPGIDPAATYLDASNNLMFRFRLGNYAPNSKGYSILIDTDNKFGSSGAQADPNYVTGNPGFEVEIELVTNFGVRLYNTDGTATPTLLTTLAYDDYAQKAVALTTNCSNPDYFYDFYIPFATITALIPGFTPATPVRMVANTVISTQSALAGPISDIAGIDDSAYGGNLESIWSTVIKGSVPTSFTTIGGGGSFPPQRSVAPVVTGPIAAGATSVSGTSTEPNGTVITVYVNGVSVGTTTVTGGTWTLTGLSALASGASVTATATATGKSESLVSNTVVVGSTCSSAPTITCTSRKGIEGNGPAGAPTGTTIRVYDPTNTLIATRSTDGTNTYLYNCNGSTTCSGGSNCMSDGVHRVTAQESGKCESIPAFACINTSGTTATPTITTTPPILVTTTSVSGTAAASSTVYLFGNGIQIGSTTASGAGAWTISGLSLSLGQVLTARALTSGQCISAASSSVTVGAVTAPPVVSGPISAGATSVSGTSTEAAGTTITVFKNGVSIGTTTVDVNGNWTLSGIAPSLVAGNTITATAQATGKSVSSTSNTVTVQAVSPAPVITGSYVEGGTSVTGTSASPDGTTIKVYMDGVLLGTTTVSGGVWTLSGLSAANYDLYASGVLTAKATEAGKNESVASNSVTVQCQTPVDRGINTLTNQICESTSAQVQVLNSETGVIYTLRNATNTADLSTSLLGTGGDITFQSFTFTSNQTVRVNALKIPISSCTSLLSSSSSITVNPNPPTNNAVVYSSTIPAGSSASIDVQNTNNGFEYQLKDNGTNADVGSAGVSSSDGSTVTLSTGVLAADADLYVEVTDLTRSTNCISRLAASIVIALPVDLLWLRASRVEQVTYIRWATTSEKENHYFLVEKSTDGKTFSVLGRVEGKGTTQIYTSYSFTDPVALSGTAYYRLKQVDFSGQFSYSKWVAVYPTHQTDTWQVHVSPHPWEPAQGCTIEVPGMRGTLHAELYTSQGKPVARFTRRITETDFSFELPRLSIAPGVYVLKLIQGNTYRYVSILRL